MDIHFYELFITFCLPLKLDQNRLVQPVLVSAERSGINPKPTNPGETVLPPGGAILFFPENNGHSRPDNQTPSGKWLGM